MAFVPKKECQPVLLLMNKYIVRSKTSGSKNEPWWQFAFFPASLLVSFVGLTISFMAHFPGGMTFDSFVMWGWGWEWPRHDWHSTYISLLMSVARQIRDDPAAYLFVQLFFHWGGLYFFSAALRKSVGKWALLIPLLGFTPVFLGLSGYLHKTPIQTAIFLFAFGVIFLHQAWGRRLSGLWILGLLILLFVGIPMRRFGYLTVIPLLVYLLYVVFSREGIRPFVKYLLGACGISVTSMLVYNFITYDVFNTNPRYKVQTVYEYDLAAIYVLTGINYAPDLVHKGFLQHQAAQKEYVKQNGLWRIMNIYKRTSNPLVVASYKESWQRAVKNHPDIWFQHKLRTFAKSLGYNTKMIGAFRGDWTYKTRKNVFGLQKSKNYIYSLTHRYMIEAKNCWCLKPWIWLIITYVMLCLGSLIWLRRSTLREVLLPHMVLLTSAGLFYPAYFLVSLDRDLRFTYWALTAAPLAILGMLLTFLNYWIKGKSLDAKSE